MDLRIPDNWLKEYCKTKANPKQIRELVSLAGPSVERVDVVGNQQVYFIEITGNRPDAMSVSGVAREAAAILPRFGVAAQFVHDPYAVDTTGTREWKGPLALSVTTDAALNPRFTAVILDGVTVRDANEEIRQRLELCGIRPINNVVDITNYLMLSYGQPVHAFDYDTIGKKDGTPTMILRPSTAGERITTLDGKTYALPGDDIVIEDGQGRLIDLCGIMGGQLSQITPNTKRVILFVQTYDPSHIRKTSMSTAARTDAAVLFEKGTDPELVLPTIVTGVDLLARHAQARIASPLTDIYPAPYTPPTISVPRPLVTRYLGIELSTDELTETLTPLGFGPKIGKDDITVAVPSWRRDVVHDVDVIEEIARIHGYHALPTKLPDTPPPLVFPDPVLGWEREIKARMRDWGYTETYTFSMISEQLVETWKLDPQKMYRIINPLSTEWVYLRPTIVPGMVDCVRGNLPHETAPIALFELSMVYGFRNADLPDERPRLVVARTGDAWQTCRGVAEALFALFGIGFPEVSRLQDERYHPQRAISIGSYGTLGELHPAFLSSLDIHTRITVLDLDVAKLVGSANLTKTFRPIPKFPPVIEDMAFTMPPQTEIGPILQKIGQLDPLIVAATLLDTYHDVRTIRIAYRSETRTLTTEDIEPLRRKITDMMKDSVGALLKTS